MYKTILVPIDLGDIETAKNALDTAIWLAQSGGGTLRLINVQLMVPITYMDFAPTDFLEKQREWATNELAGIAKKLDFPQDRLSTHIRIGGTYPEILAEAEECGADIIVIGSHQPAMSTYLLGSTAKSVVRHAKCSVLVVRS